MLAFKHASCRRRIRPINVRRRVRSINVSGYTSSDQITDPSLQSTLRSHGTAYLRIPYRLNFTDADYLKILNAVKGAGATPQVIVRGNCTVDVPASQHLLSLVDQVFPSQRYWVEYGNENDGQCALSASGYVDGWNRDVPQLKAAHPNALFIGPVNSYYNSSHLLYFLRNANPRPDGVSWHDYACNTSNTDKYCMAAISRWDNHIRGAEANFVTAGYRVPVWISEWNLDPFGDPRLDGKRGRPRLRDTSWMLQPPNQPIAEARIRSLGRGVS